MECPSCDGYGCEQCNQSGTIEITECPLKIITGDIWELLQAARLAEKGILPLPGGWLDQTQWFVEAVDFVWGEQSVAKAETMRGFSNGI